MKTSSLFILLTLLLLGQEVSAQTTQILITSGDSWKFFATGAAPGSPHWTGSGSFDDAAWQQGPSPLGYGNDGERTLVGYGPSPTNKYITTYFRKTLTLASASGSFTLRYKRDDGIVIYINGVELKREYLPTGPVAYATLATTVPEAEEPLWKTIILPAGLLRTGTNVLAAEVHQASLTSSDMRFDLDLTQAASSTPPAQTRPIRIWALGDFGVDSMETPAGHIRHRKVRDGFTNYLSRNNIDYVNMWLWLGDNAYDWGTAQQYQKNVFDMYDSRLEPGQRIMKQTPIYATPGNHDYKNSLTSGSPLSRDPNDPLTRQTHKIHYYDVVNNYTRGEYSGVHSGREEYYSYDYGNIHFVSLDTYGFECEKQPNGTYNCPSYNILDTDPDPARNGEPKSAQVRWMKRDLEKAQQDARIKWIIVVTHYPVYSMGTKNSDTDPEIKPLREKFLKFLENYRVDLVMTGHSHVYERSKPVQGHYGLEGELLTADSTRFLAPTPTDITSSGWYACSSASLPNSLLYFKKSSDPKNYIVHAVSGSGGALAGGLQPSWPHAVMQQSRNIGGSMYLEITGNRLDAKFITEDSEVGDQFTIIKESDGFQIPATNGSTHTPDCECTEGAKPVASAYTHYVRRNPAGNADLLLSIKKNGANIGKIGDGTFDLQVKGRPGSTYIDSAEPNDYVRASLMVMNRHWMLKSTQELPPAATASVRYYWNRSDYTGFTNLNGSTWETNSDQMFETITINDNGGQTVRYERDPTVDRHRNIPKAGDYRANGAWIYKNGPVASTSTYKFGLPNPGISRFQYSEFSVGRLRFTGGTIGGLLSPNLSNARITAPGAENQTGQTTSVYPNPTLDGKVYFAPALPYQSFQLTDLQGKVLKRANEAGSLAQLDLSGLPTGLYVLISQGEYGISRFKLIRN